MSPHRAARLLGSLAVLLLLTSTGCVVNVAWLPDSSGFVFCNGEGRQLFLYDTQKKAKRILVADTKTQTAWSAVSPDGRRVAVARLMTHQDASDTVEIIVYDLDGKEVKRSPTFRWGPPSASSNNQLGTTFLFWSPKTEHIIVLAGEITGLYDVRNDGMIMLDEAMPFVVGHTPVRPDGDGFLLSKKVEDRLAYRFVTWEGREYNLAMNPLAATNANEWARFPVLYNARWEGNTAVVRHSDSCLRLDTSRYRGVTEGGPVREDEVVEEVRRQVAFANGSQLRVLFLCENGAKDSTFNQVEFLDRPEGKPRAVVERMQCSLIFPSPDRKLVALRGMFDGKGDRILLINERGEVLSEVTPGP